MLEILSLSLPLSQELQNNFIITYVDMADNNYAITCKYYNNLISTTAVTSNSILKLPHVTLEEKNKHILSYHNLLGLKSNNLNHPHIVMISKFLKNPFIFTTITVRKQFIKHSG